jgi:hypothetical protein
MFMAELRWIQQGFAECDIQRYVFDRIEAG